LKGEKERQSALRTQLKKKEGEQLLTRYGGQQKDGNDCLATGKMRQREIHKGEGDTRKKKKEGVTHSFEVNGREKIVSSALLNSRPKSEKGKNLAIKGKGRVRNEKKRETTRRKDPGGARGKRWYAEEGSVPEKGRKRKKPGRNQLLAVHGKKYSIRTGTKERKKKNKQEFLLG